ncbi:hypothetical protein FGM00_15010 [Aggregatimonas sangjinii]|uniref:Lipocalin-like domain-containing protein n=1 Tax=Aggregatimonas sangjinii TaxID=2583587 RepID=A0A5B7SX92_9FLAO|nr:hypothetical protein [Aggregatimonas sangjinii]QCX01354.1 hypothetical protein FGM00_15010 [Aggregatimonas sangjinii]
MRKITTILLLAILAVSCSADNPEEGVVNVDLEGNWVLENVSCFCFFEPDTDFSTHRISFEGSKLTVSSTDDNFFLMEDGKYNYTVAGNLITFPDGVQYRYQVDNQQLQLNFVDNPELADDEVTFTYYKK